MLKDSIVRGSNAEEYSSLLKLLEIINMAPEEYFSARYLNDPYTDPSLSRLVEVEGKMVSHIRIFRRPVNGGMTPLIMGAIGNVGTLVEHRKKGYCRALLEDGVRLMKEQGYDYSTVLSGVGVYAKCGWDEIESPRYIIHIDEAFVDVPNSYRIRRFQRDTDLEQISDIYNDFNYLRPLCVDRTRLYWQKHLNWVDENNNMFLVVENDHEVVAYMRGSGNGPKVEVFEMAHKKGFEEAYLAIINLMIRYKNKYGWESLELNLPSDHEFLNLVKNYFPMEKITKGNLLVKLINLQQILKKLQYNMQSSLNTYDGEKNAGFKIICDGQQGCIEIKNGIIQIKDDMKDYKALKLSQKQFFNLIFHFKNYSELGLINDINEEEIKLLNHLFIGKHAVYWGPDGV